jgi:hypothetical protein
MTIIAGKIVKADTSEYIVSKTVISPKELNTGKLANIIAANPPMTVKPDTIIA